VKIRVDVISEQQLSANGKPYQVLAVYFPGSLLPVESKLFLGKDQPKPKGQYELDLANGGLTADSRNFNNPRFEFRRMAPKVAPAAAKAG
jgi:hypothetical protein